MYLHIFAISIQRVIVGGIKNGTLSVEPLFAGGRYFFTCNRDALTEVWRLFPALIPAVQHYGDRSVIMDLYLHILLEPPCFNF